MRSRWQSTLYLYAALASSPVMGASAESAELFEQAQKREAALDFEGALGLVRKALAQGGARAELTWQLYAAEGRLASVVGLADEATMAFSRALNLRPTFELPPDASPRMAAPYKTAKATLVSERLTAVPSSERLAQGQVQTRLRIEGDVLQLVATARLLPAGAGPVTFTRTDTLVAFWSCTREPCAHEVSVLDARGNELLRLGSAASPLMVVELVKPVPVVLKDERPFYRRGWPYLVLGAVSAAVGVYVATRCAQLDAEFRAARDNPTEHSFSQVRGLDAARWSYYAGAWTALGLTVGLGTLSAVLW